ncbi:hypothetical protein SDC9_187785 [bioreactor metagenome]|uniref:Uncharacterized protein n=1 Tax=bioreactor metagenome TaxID=1076179 RepID=A0A645HPS7_9ZZZZ
MSFLCHQLADFSVAQQGERFPFKIHARLAVAKTVISGMGGFVALQQVPTQSDNETDRHLRHRVGI